MSKNCKIILADGGIALVSPEDADLSLLNWCRCSRNKMFNGERREGYARRHLECVTHKGKRKQVYQYLHHEVAKRIGITGIPDHINGSTLDCTRENLRHATHKQNMRNRAGWSKSGFKGVYSRNGKWEAYILKKYLGTFDAPELAAIAYDEAAIKQFGEFARLNFPNKQQRKAA